MHFMVASLISSGGDHDMYYWWDLIRSKQLSSDFVCPVQCVAWFSGHGNSIYMIKIYQEGKASVLMIWDVCSKLKLSLLSLSLSLSLSIYIYIYIFWSIDLVVRVFANGLKDRGSIPGRVIPKTQKLVLDTFLLNTQHYKVWIKGKVEQSSKKSSTLPNTLV